MDPAAQAVRAVAMAQADRTAMRPARVATAVSVDRVVTAAAAVAAVTAAAVPQVAAAERLRGRRRRRRRIQLRSGRNDLPDRRTNEQRACRDQLSAARLWRRRPWAHEDDDDRQSRSHGAIRSRRAEQRSRRCHGRRRDRLVPGVLHLRVRYVRRHSRTSVELGDWRSGQWRERHVQRHGRRGRVCWSRHADQHRYGLGDRDRDATRPTTRTTPRSTSRKCRTRST